MKKILSALSLAAVLISACSSVPEGTVKPSLTIDGVTFGSHGEAEGYFVDFTVRHASLEALPVEEILIDVNVNGLDAGSYAYEPKNPLPANYDNKFSVFVPDTASQPAAKNSLKTNRMLQLKNVTKVQLLVDKDLDSRNAAFNQTAVFNGVIHAAEQ